MPQGLEEILSIFDAVRHRNATEPGKTEKTLSKLWILKPKILQGCRAGVEMLCRILRCMKRIRRAPHPAGCSLKSSTWSRSLCRVPPVRSMGGQRR